MTNIAKDVSVRASVMLALLSVPSLALAQEGSVDAKLERVNEILAANQDFSRTCGAVYQYWAVLELGDDGQLIVKSSQPGRGGSDQCVSLERRDEIHVDDIEPANLSAVRDGGFSVIRLWCKDEPCVNRITVAHRSVVSRETAAEIRFYPNDEAAEELTAELAQLIELAAAKSAK